MTEKAANSVMLVDEQPDYGIRSPLAFGVRGTTIHDQFGHEWLPGHELEAISPQEIKRRFEAEQRERVGS